VETDIDNGLTRASQKKRTQEKQKTPGRRRKGKIVVRETLSSWIVLDQGKCRKENRGGVPGGWKEKDKFFQRLMSAKKGNKFKTGTRLWPGRTEGSSKPPAKEMGYAG